MACISVTNTLYAMEGPEEMYFKLSSLSLISHPNLAFDIGLESIVNDPSTE